MSCLLFIDFESFYDSSKAVGYDLRKLSIVQYIRDSRFKAFGAGVCGLEDKPVWVPANNLPTFLKTIGEMVEGGWQNVAVIGHNVKFDGFILKEIYDVTPGHYIDTKGMSRAVFGKSIKGHSLDLISQHYGLPSKGIMKTDGVRDLDAAAEAELAEYCLHDVELCRDIYFRLVKEFPESQYESMHRTVDMFINPKLVLNVPLLEQTSVEEAKRRANIFEEIGIEKAIFASNVKFPALLVSKGFEVPTKPSPRKKDEDGNSIQIPALALGDPEFLELLESDNEELRKLCEARVAAKSTLLETRSAKLAKIGGTGLWPFDVEFSGADQTHRFSGGSGAGGNPQNFTRDSALREAVEAPQGFELVVGDFSNVELRIVAALSKDPGLVQAIEQGIDIYCDFASVFFGRKITKANERERRFGKTAILGLGYGMGWKKFIKTVRIQTGETISAEDSKKAVGLYRERYSKVPALWAELDGSIPYLASGHTGETSCRIWPFPGKLGRQYIELPSGLRMRYPNLRQEERTRVDEETGHRYTRKEWVYDTYKKRHLEVSNLYGGKVLENISQGLAGELCKLAMEEMGDACAGQVHDELHVLARKGLGLTVAKKLQRVMSVSPAWLPNICLDAEVGVGPNWNEAK